MSNSVICREEGPVARSLSWHRFGFQWPSVFQITASAGMSSMHMIVRRPTRFTPSPDIRTRRLPGHSW